jgi:hypothetical protein
MSGSSGAGPQYRRILTRLTLYNRRISRESRSKPWSRRLLSSMRFELPQDFCSNGIGGLAREIDSKIAGAWLSRFYDPNIRGQPPPMLPPDITVSIQCIACRDRHQAGRMPLPEPSHVRVAVLRLHRSHQHGKTDLPAIPQKLINCGIVATRSLLDFTTSNLQQPVSDSVKPRLHWCAHFYGESYSGPSLPPPNLRSISASHGRRSA